MFVHASPPCICIGRSGNHGIARTSDDPLHLPLWAERALLLSLGIVPADVRHGFAFDMPELPPRQLRNCGRPTAPTPAKTSHTTSAAKSLRTTALESAGKSRASIHSSIPRSEI